MSSRRIWTLEDIPEIEANRQRWDRLRWPIGIKTDLAKATPLEVPANEQVIARTAARDNVEWLITLGYSEANRRFYSWVGRYYYQHPRKSSLFVWRRGPGLVIPSCDAMLWLDGLERIEAFEERTRGAYRGPGIYHYEIKYGRKLEGHVYHNIRFFLQNKSGTWYYQIQDFCVQEGRYKPTKRCFYWKCDDTATTERFRAALHTLDERHRTLLLPAPNSVSIESNYTEEE